MADDKEISDLGAATTLSGDEKLPAVQGGANVAATPAQIAAYVASTLGIFSGSPIRVTTIAGLTAIDSGDLLDGQCAIVGGTQGGVFFWDAASTQATDGGVTFIPDNLTAAVSPVTLTYAEFGNANGAKQLAHTNIVWGSVTIGANDGDDILDSKWFHGHAVSPRHSTGGSLVGRDAPTFDHALGQIWGDQWTRIQSVIRSNVATHATPSSRTAPLNYRYATGAGRWIRVVGDYVTPAMFGGVPSDPTIDNSFYIAWAQNWLNSQPAVKMLKFDGNYTVKGMWAEIYSGITFKGLGKDIPCVTYMGDQGGGVGGVADFLKTVYVSSGSGQTGLTTDPYLLLDLHRVVMIQFDNASGFQFEDFCLDGNNAENLYFLTGGVAWDVEIEGLISTLLRESPYSGGLYVTVQSGRVIAPDTSWGMHRTTIMNTLGSCIAYANGGRMDCSNIALGNSLSGRVFYGGQGEGTGITMFGYTRTSFWSPYNGHFSNVRWKDIAENPWPENSVVPHLLSARGEPYIDWADQVGYSAVVQERYGDRHLTLDGFSATLDEPVNILLYIAGGSRVDLSGGSIYGPTSDPFIIAISPAETVTGIMSGPAVNNLRFLNRSADGVELFNCNSTGYFTKAYFSDIHIQETYVDGVRLSKPANLADPAICNLLNVNMDPLPEEGAPGFPLPFFPTQRVDVVDTHFDTHVEFLAILEGGGDADGVPTEIHLSNSSFVTEHNKLFKSLETDVTFSSKLKIFFTNVVIDLWDPGVAARGDADVTDPWIARLVARNWRTRDGRVSEIDEITTRTAVAGATITVTIASPGVVTWTAHGLSNGARVQFQNSGGTLPTGITAGSIYYVVNKATDTFQVASSAGGTAINTSDSQSGTHTAAKYDTEVLATITNTLGYIDFPVNLLWKPMTYSVSPLSANAVTVGIPSVSAVYPQTTPPVPDNTRPRLRVGVGTVTAGQTLTYNLRAAVAPPRSLN